MAIVLRHAPYVTSAGTGVNPVTVSGVEVVEGDAIVALYQIGNSLTAVTFSDNAAGGTNTWLSEGSGVNVSPGGIMMRAGAALARATETLTVSAQNVGGNTNCPVLVVLVLSGCHQVLSELVRVIAYDTVEGAAAKTHTGATISALISDYLITHWGQDYAGSTFSDQSGFTQLCQTVGPNAYFAVYGKIASASGDYYQNTNSTANIYCGNSILAIRAAVLPFGSAFVAPRKPMVFDIPAPSVGTNPQVYSGNYVVNYSGSTLSAEYPEVPDGSTFVFKTPAGQGQTYDTTRMFLVF